MLIESTELGCSEEVLSILGMLSAGNIFYRPKDKAQQADAKKAKFHQPEGDHLTLLTVFNAYRAANGSAPWCNESFVQHRSMKRAVDIRKQLLGIMERYKNPITSCGKNYSRVCRAICAGFFQHAAKKDPQEGYKTCVAHFEALELGLMCSRSLVNGTPVHLHPSSSLFQRPCVQSLPSIAR